MKAAVYAGPAEHQIAHTAAFADGLARHGIEVLPYRYKAPPADFAVTWGWRNGKRLRAEGREVLIMERGYLGDRFAWTSLGWNGLNGRAQFGAPGDSTRFKKHFEPLMKEQSLNGEYALIIGQVRGDQALENVNIEEWYCKARKTMERRGFPVYFRAHPVSLSRRQVISNNDIQLHGSLEDALVGAHVVVTYNSNTGVDAIMAGRAVMVSDIGSMVYDIAIKTMSEDIRLPKRDHHLQNLAWKQFTLDEIRSGFAWEVAKTYRVEEENTQPKRALVIGGSKDVWTEVEAGLDLCEYDAIVCINDAVMTWPGRVDMAVTLHPNKIETWLKHRADKKYSPVSYIVSYRGSSLVNEVISYRWPEMAYSGSSGLYAAKVLLEKGFSHIVLCGVPLDNSPHYLRGETGWLQAENFKPAWKASLHRLVGKVKSFSGWTKEVLGEPTREWLSCN